jgi:hypothetical protein
LNKNSDPQIAFISALRIVTTKLIIFRASYHGSMILARGEAKKKK